MVYDRDPQRIENEPLVERDPIQGERRLGWGMVAALVILFALFTWVAGPRDKAPQINTTERATPNAMPPKPAPSENP